MTSLFGSDEYHHQKQDFSYAPLSWSYNYREAPKATYLLLLDNYISKMAENKEQAPADNGRYDELQNGPLQPSQRECRDVFCCLLFTLNILAMIALAIYGYTYGNTHNIYRGTDNNQNICGKTGTATENFPLSYFYNPTTGDLSKRVCVSGCPYYSSSGVLSGLSCFTTGNTPSCSYTVTVKQDGSYSGTTSTNSFIGYDSTEQIGRICLPTTTVLKNAFSSVSTTISDGVRQAGLANFITDLQNNWRWLLLSMALAIVISVLFMFFLRCFAGCVVWLSIILLILLTVALGILFCYNGGAISRDSYIGNMGIAIPTLPANSYYNIFGYVSFGLAAVILLATICCCSRLRIAVAVCGVAGQFVAGVCQTVLVPLFMGALLFVLWVACILAMIGLIGGANFVVKGNDVFTGIQDYTDNYLAMFYYFVFGTLWTNALLQAITIFVIASACALWYFNQQGAGSMESKIDSPICTSYWMAFRFHLGSLAFGSFILALVEFIQFIVEVFNKQAEASGAQNKLTECCMNCVRCCIQCLKRIIECLNRNAYIQIAITGKGFCGASYDAFSMIASNPLRYGAVEGVGFILMLLGKLMIAGLTTFLFYLLITFVNDIRANVQEPIYLLVLVFIASFAIAVVFMAVYSVAMEAILACFIVDQAISKGRPSHGPPGLSELMDK